MNMNQFTQEILKALGAVKEQPISESNFFARRESQLMLQELEQLILSYQHSREHVTSRSVQPFCQFLTKRFHLIKNTQLAYFINKSSENEKCWILATLLSPIVKNHFLQLLIPTLEMAVRELPNIRFHENKANDFFINQSGNALIRRSTVLNYAAVKNGLLASTYEMNGQKRELTDSEKNLVINYNQESKIYYEKIISQQNFKKAKQVYLDTLIGSRSNLLQEFGYGKQGEDDLTVRILQKSKTFTELIELIANRVKKSDWEWMMKNVDMDILAKLILHDDKRALSEETLMSALKKLTFQSGNEKVDRATGFFVLPGYWEGLREHQGEFKSLMAHIFGRWVAYSKEDKKEAVKIGRAFLLSDSPLSEQGLNEFLKNTGKEHIKGALLEEGSILGWIFSNILRINHPVMEKTVSEKSSSASSLFGLWTTKTPIAQPEEKPISTPSGPGFYHA